MSVSPSGHHPLQTMMTIDPGCLLLALHLLLLSLLARLLLAQQCLCLLLPHAHNVNTMCLISLVMCMMMTDTQLKSCWHDIIREPGPSHWLEPQMPGNLPGTPIAPPAHTPTPPTTSDSEDDVEQLCCEGGVDLAAFLMSKAIPIQAVSAETKPICKWTYRDILKLSAAAQEEWKAACQFKLDILHKCKVYELVDPPKGHKVIDN